MLSFAKTHLSFCFLFLLCVAGFVACAPATTHHRRHLHSGPFPYGKLADKLLTVNDRNYDVPYMNDNLEEDMVRVYPENHSFSSGIPTASFEPKLSLPFNSIPNVGIKDILSFAHRIQDIIKNVVIQEWDNTLVGWRTMARD